MLEPLRPWFLEHKRSMPWRENPTPYAVWISEIMLQQTQVAVVIPYFTRWMEAFPTVRALAGAPLERVIKIWEGLGYYSRARNLHKGAQLIVAHFGGELPSDPEALATIPGIGPYTLGAIRSFAFHQKAAAVDGNVLRVLSRVLKIEEDIAKPKTVLHIRQQAETLLPNNEPWIIAEALIELGATLCKKEPQCSQCPLRHVCAARRDGVADKLPLNSKKSANIPLHRFVAVIQSPTHLLLKKGEKGDIMYDLYEFPFVETTPQGLTSQTLQQHFETKGNLQLQLIKTLPIQKHGFTKYSATLYPFHFETATHPAIDGYRWIEQDHVKNLPFSSGHRKILQTL